MTSATFSSKGLQTTILKASLEYLVLKYGADAVRNSSRSFLEEIYNDGGPCGEEHGATTMKASSSSLVVGKKKNPQISTTLSQEATRTEEEAKSAPLAQVQRGGGGGRSKTLWSDMMLSSESEENE